MQEGIIPAWEDEANKNGGKWSIQLPKDKNRANVDKMWLYTVRPTAHHADVNHSQPRSRAQMLAAIGETFDPLLQSADASRPPESLVTGVIVSTRPQFYRVSIWTRTAPAGPEDEELRQRIESIGKHFKTTVLGYADNARLSGPLATEVEFLSHKDSEKKGKSKKIVV